MSALGFLKDELNALELSGLLRDPASALVPPGHIDLCSNDYLGYGRRRIELGERGGAGASRLVTGTFSAHLEAEAALASWLGHPSALLFSSGYAANVGVLSALGGEGDLIISDERNHASIIDGCRLSRARIVVAPHLRVEAIEAALRASARRRFVVVESYYSMDGDSPDLAAIRGLCTAHGAALIVDEAHAVGVFGDSGRGRCAEVGVTPDVLVGTLGKALGLGGAFVAGPASLRTFLWNRARSFVFSTGLSPALSALLASRVGEVASDDAGRARLRLVERTLRAALDLGGEGPVVPVVLGEAASAVRASSWLRERGIVVQAIRPPTVAPGASRLRMTGTAALQDEELAFVTETLLEGRAAGLFGGRSNCFT
jgi:8-amino-7-oxononanoate synthase